jgi:gamma-glutamyl:cysteine ligase YbdK (ATP-grasp superfamily)
VNVENPSRPDVPTALHAFAGYGIELEYAIVDAATLAPRPLGEPLLRAMDSGRPKRIDGVEIDWSNELVQHVVEIKNVAPVPSLEPLVTAFRDGVAQTVRRTGDFDALLMPTGMHPWMDARTAELWTHSDGDIYRTFDRIFDCRRHGWANLQSMHINLPFADDDEFARLHAAVRLVLPLVPALAASSPLADGQRMPFLDYRLEVYRTNAERVPAITGAVIPDNVRGRVDYQTSVLEPMYRAIAADDPERILQHEWLNGRGAIARFDRNAIEIRLCDTQECPRADLAIAAIVTSVVRALYDARWQPLDAQQALPTSRLAALLQATIRDGEDAPIADADYLRVFGLSAAALRAGDLWAHLLDECDATASALNRSCRAPIETILAHGSLARRILHAANGDTTRERLGSIYRRLCDCLTGDELFVPEA